jgi:hypothetical protein
MEFKKFPKIPRFNRDIIITEKIDGTNAQIFIELRDDPDCLDMIASSTAPYTLVVKDGMEYVMLAGSRRRWLSAESDNFGFGKWVSDNRDELLELGPGQHFGEWWGSGIQRGYGLPKGEKRLSLFNTHRWGEERPACCNVVPILYEGPMSEAAIHDSLARLRKHGSYAQDAFMNPEGIVVFHKAANALFKILLENDEIPKSMIKEEG